MFPRVRFGLPAAILTQNAFSSKKSSNKMSFPSPLYSKKCFLALPRVWGSFWNWKFGLRAEQNVALAGAWGHFFTESAPIPSESIIEKVALTRIWRTLRNCRCAFFFIRLCFFFPKSCSRCGLAHFLDRCLGWFLRPIFGQYSFHTTFLDSSGALDRDQKLQNVADFSFRGRKHAFNLLLL